MREIICMLSYYCVTHVFYNLYRRAKSEMTAVPETPIERPRSLAAPSASPETSAPNPIMPISRMNVEPLVSEAAQMLLKEQFEELEAKGYLQ